MDKLRFTMPNDAITDADQAAHDRWIEEAAERDQSAGIARAHAIGQPVAFSLGVVLGLIGGVALSAWL